jgi:hypothetical protein
LLTHLLYIHVTGVVAIAMLDREASCNAPRAGDKRKPED